MIHLMIQHITKAFNSADFPPQHLYCRGWVCSRDVENQRCCSLEMSAASFKILLSIFSRHTINISTSVRYSRWFYFLNGFCKYSLRRPLFFWTWGTSSLCFPSMHQWNHIKTQKINGKNNTQWETWWLLTRVMSHSRVHEIVFAVLIFTPLSLRMAQLCKMPWYLVLNHEAQRWLCPPSTSGRSWALKPQREKPGEGI